jgi:polar amino acid transport system substrate-binding protein
MAIVHGIVKQHNGFITVRSELGAGTTFRVYLPKVEADQGSLVEELPLQGQPQGGSETILVAEDDIDVRTLITSILAHAGYDVIEAEDGEAAIEQFRAHKDRITLILMDMIMPGKNGQEAYEEISRLKPGVKVLYVSGYTADFMKNRGVSEERVNLMLKPILPRDLMQKVREMLDS